MAISGRGDAPFRSIWCNAVNTRRPIEYPTGAGSGIDEAIRDWFFGSEGAPPPPPPPVERRSLSGRKVAALAPETLPQSRARRAPLPKFAPEAPVVEAVPHRREPAAVELPLPEGGTRRGRLVRDVPQDQDVLPKRRRPTLLLPPLPVGGAKRGKLSPFVEPAPVEVQPRRRPPNPPWLFAWWPFVVGGARRGRLPDRASGPPPDQTPEDSLRRRRADEGDGRRLRGEGDDERRGRAEMADVRPVRATVGDDERRARGDEGSQRPTRNDEPR